MSTLEKAAQQALEALEDWDSPVALPAITALKAALAQPEQEPVAWQGVYDKTDLFYRKPPQADVRPLYTHPPRREWVGLTEEERADILFPLTAAGASDMECARAVEQALKERNT
jgi:hypothetical protein